MALRRPQRIGPVVAPERFAVGQHRGVCLIGRASRRLLDRFGFSWTIAVLPRTARKQGLDFLGFSRQNLDFSMGYAGFSAKKISRALLPLGSALGQEPVFLRCRSAVSLIEQV